MNRALPGARTASITVVFLSAMGSASMPVSAEDVSLAPMVVTATRTAVPLTAVLGNVSVIDREVIDQATGLSVSELLRQYAGVQISNNGGLGKESTVFLRGTEARHVLLLIDGVVYGSATKGTPNWDNLALSSIERIEILRGPAASLYGSDAVGGVVQIFTREGTAGKAQPYLNSTLGSYGRHEFSAGVSGGSPAIRYAVGIATTRETGFSARNVSAGTSYNPDEDGFDQQSMYANVRWSLTPSLDLGASVMVSSGNNQFDSSSFGSANYDVRGLTTTRASGLNLSKTWSHGGQTRVRFSRADDLTRNLYRTATTVFDTSREQWGLQHDQPVALGTLSLGVDSLLEEVSSTDNYAVKKRTVDGIFAALQGSRGAHRWQVSARHDDNSQFGHATTGALGYGYELLPSWTMVASMGTSFKAPTFNQLYSPTVTSSFRANPDLRPEKGLGKEVGLRYASGSQRWDLTIFSNEIDGLIVNGNPVINAQKAKISGLSLGGQYVQGVWKISGNLEILNALNKTPGSTYNRKLPRRADEQLTLSLERALDGWWLGVHALLASSRLDSSSSDRVLPGFGTLALSAERALGDDWSLQIRVNNLGDKVYETAYSYNQPGRSIYTTLNWRPKR